MSDDVRKTLIWTGVALVVGFLLAAWVLHQPAPNPTPRLVPVVVLATATPAIASSPTPVPSPPVVTADVHTVTRVIITRPVRPPAPGNGPSVTDPAATGPDPGEETITFVTETDASAAAPIVTPPPPAAPILVVATSDPGLPAGNGGDRLAGLGVTAGLFDGYVAVDLEPFAWPVAGTEIGPSLMINTHMAGVGASVALPWVQKHLYLEAGGAQAYSWQFNPRPFVGVGLRL